MIEAKKKKIRCAIYTRKSTEEGLDQEFNSLDSQRESCEAYIKSQMHEGWELIEKHYDDGGFSGGTMDRPAFKELLYDIQKDQVDIVVVYKVDRLTRSLMDFSKIVELFDKHNASFVSITQHFNTTTSMGRLTLNILLSFAQFEREVTSERIRDKIAASKKKGIWMGGCTPMGYKKIEKKLVPEETTTEKIRTIFNKYIELRGAIKLRNYLNENQIKTPNGRDFSTGHLYNILSNKVYIGKVVHQGIAYEGEHQGLIDEELFNKTQQILLENKVNNICGNRSCSNSLLTGLIFDDKNNTMSPTSSGGKSKVYKYYASQPTLKHYKGRSGSVPKVPAKEIETFVKKTIKEFLQNKQKLHAEISEFEVSTQNLILNTLDKLQDFSNHKFIRSFLRKVVVSNEYIEITLCQKSLIETIDKIARDEPLLPETSTETGTPIVISKIIKIKRVHKRGNLMIIDAENNAFFNHNQYLINAIVKSHYWNKLLLEGKAKSYEAIQKMEGLTDTTYVRKIMMLKFLPPQITESILNGSQQSDLSLDKLLKVN